MFEDFLFQKEKISLEENELKITLFVPGYGKDDFIIEQQDSVLVISSKDDHINKRYELPKNICEIKASCKNGILEIILLKAKISKKLITVN